MEYIGPVWIKVKFNRYVYTEYWT